MRALVTRTFLAGILTTCAAVAQQVPLQADSELKPLSTEAPVFPEECGGERLEAHYVEVEYDVGVDGSVENLRITGSSSECFHESAIGAASGFRFEPRRVGGVPVAVTGLRNRFTFSLASMRDDVESELQAVEQKLFDGDGAGALELLARFEAERGRKVNRHEYASFLWMRGVAHSLEKNYSAARDDLRAALDSNDLYPETIDWIQSILKKVEAQAGP